MTLAVEVSSEVGVSKDNIHYGSFRKWLTPVSARATIHPDKSHPPVEVGNAVAFIIRRSMILPNFHEEMETPHEGTMNLAIELFDRYGRLKEEIRKHALRKGSGVWGKELEEGNFLLVEDVKVKRMHRRKRIASKLVLHILQQAMMPRHNVTFAFARAAAHYNDGESAVNTRPSNLSHHEKVDGVVAFLRFLRFRRVGLTPWLALARDNEHPSRHMARDKDADPKREIDWLIESDSDEEVIDCNPDFTQTRVKKSEWEDCFLGNSPKEKPVITSRKRPLHYALKTLPDKHALAFLKSQTREGSLNELPLKALDGRGDTVLHVAAKASMPACVAWLLRQPTIAALVRVDNYAGYTPLEALQSQLESRRVQAPYGHLRTQLVADTFNGFDEDSVSCLLLFQTSNEPSPEQRIRAKFGCSCGECLDGFLSPRMLKKLKDQADSQYSYLTGLTLPGERGWYSEFKSLLTHLPESFQSHIRHSKVLQASFVQLVAAVLACLSKGIIPRKAAVVAHLQTAMGLDQYFAEGGSVAAVVGAIVDQARLLDLEVGDGLLDLEPEKYYRGRPNCRNDLEFEFVRRHCVDDSPPEKKTGTPLP